MSMLKCVWLLLCTWLSLCAAPPHAPGDSYSRNKRQGQQIALDFTLFSNSTTDCSAGLSNQGVSVAVSYRTFTDQGSSEWILMLPIIGTPATASCSSNPFTARTPTDISGRDSIQFRFVQEEHAGGYCNCWAIDNLVGFKMWQRKDNQ